jgi:hypothetical protein
VVLFEGGWDVGRKVGREYVCIEVTKLSGQIERWRSRKGFWRAVRDR